MNPINKFLEDELGARPAPEPAPITVRRKRVFEKVVGESKAARRMRRRQAAR